MLDRSRPTRIRAGSRLLALASSAALLAGAAVAVTGPPAAAAERGLRLLSAADVVEAYAYDGYVYLQPAVWLASYGEANEFTATRAHYADPVTLTRTVIRGGQRTSSTVPQRLVDDHMGGLRDGLTVTVSTTSGTVLSTQTSALCPSGWNRSRVDPTGPSREVYPTYCGGNWFTRATVFGIEQGWAVQPETYLDVQTNRKKLVMTTTVSAPVARYLGLPTRSVTQQVQVYDEDECLLGCRTAKTAVAAQAVQDAQQAQQGPLRVDGREALRDSDVPAGERAAYSTTRRAAPSAATARSSAPARDTLPDLVSLPAWQISTEVDEEGTDRLDFAAHEWNAGPAPMVVEGFRQGTKPVMDAYQMFYRDGEAVGSRKTGTMEFHDAPEHHHWHFLDFAKYELVRPDGSLVTTSGKQSWCLAPTDPVDLTLPTAVWRPEATGLESTCGEEDALWLRESMPVGWGDTYSQYQTQAFDLTGVPNGRYRIRVTVNPNGNLYERTRANNVSLRTVKIGGRPGHRTVTVPPYQGVDTEHWYDELG